MISAFSEASQLLVGCDRGFEVGKARVHPGNLGVHGRNGIGIALDGGVAVVNHLVQGLDLGALDGLRIPLIHAQATEAERKGDEEVLLEVFHGVESGAALTEMATF